MPRGDAARPPRLDGAPLDYAPENELGVVFLFSSLARSRFGLRVKRIGANFPDCTAYLGQKRIRIEFEYRSRNFALHRHNPGNCDWLVCWIHDWPACPLRLRVVELRKEFGLGFNVWCMPVKWEFAEGITTVPSRTTWSVPAQATAGDLLLFYRAGPYKDIRDLFRIAGPISYKKQARWKEGRGFRRSDDWFAAIKRVATLKAPIFWKELKAHPVLQSAYFVRRQMQGRSCVTPYWPELFEMLIQRNPGLKRSLDPVGPRRLVGAGNYRHHESASGCR